LRQSNEIKEIKEINARITGLENKMQQIIHLLQNKIDSNENNNIDNNIDNEGNDYNEGV